MSDLETIRRAHELQQALELLAIIELGFPVPQPPPQLKAAATLQALATIYNNPDRAMNLSQTVTEALKSADIRLNPDETFASMICVINKPEFASELTDPSPEPAIRSLANLPNPMDEYHSRQLTAKAWQAVCHNVIMEPAIMKAVLEMKEKDKIIY